MAIEGYIGPGEGVCNTEQLIVNDFCDLFYNTCLQTLGLNGRFEGPENWNKGERFVASTRS